MSESAVEKYSSMIRLSFNQEDVRLYVCYVLKIREVIFTMTVISTSLGILTD